MCRSSNIWIAASTWLLACAGEPEPGPAPVEAAAPALIVETDTPPSAAVGTQPGASERESQPIPERFVPTTRGEGSCVVTLVALLEAENYRGAGPITPSLEAAMNADPEFARMWESEGHGDHHIQCHYEVRLESRPQQRYRWRVVYGNTLEDRSPEICKTRLGEIAEDIISTTEQCTQLAAGAYYGDVLEPM